MLLVGLGTLAVTVDATPEPAGPRSVGPIGDGAVVPDAKAAQLLGATAVGLEAELRRVDAGHRGSVRVLDANLVRLRDVQADLADQQVALESRLTAAIELAAVKGIAPDLMQDVRALQLVAAALLLQEGAASGRPFASVLEQFAAIVAGVDSADLEADLPPVTELIASLQPYSETGVVSWRDLRRSFASLAGLIDRADPSSWWDWALVMAGWRDDPLRSLHEAQAALMVDDLEGAIASLATFEGEAALVTEGWLALAQARLAADAMVNDLYQVALAAGASPSASGATLASSSGTEAAPTRSVAPAPWRAAQTTSPAGALSR